MLSSYLRVIITTALLIVACSFSFAPELIKESLVFEVNATSAIMFDFKEKPFGPRSRFLRGDLLFFPSDLTQMNSVKLEEYAHKTVVLPCKDYPASVVERLLNAEIRGLLLEYCEAVSKRDETITEMLRASSVPFPVLFLPRQAELGPFGERSRFAVKFGVSHVAPSPLRRFNTSLVHGTLTSKSAPAKDSSTAVPHILVSSHYDTLGLDVLSSSSNNVYATPAVIEVWRRLRSTRTASPYRLSVILGTTSHLAFQGTKAFMQKEASRGSKFTAAISVEELLPTDLSETTLYAHYHGGADKSEEYASIISHIEKVARLTGVQVELVKSTKRYSRQNPNFEFEVFHRFSVPGVTFSTCRTSDCHSLVDTPNHAPISLSNPAAAALLADRITFLHRLVEELCGVSHDESVQWSGTQRYVQGLAQLLSRAVRSSSSLAAKEQVSLNQEDVAEELMQTMKRGDSPSAVTVVKTHTKELPSGDLKLFPLPIERLAVYQRMMWDQKLMFTGFTVSLVFFLLSFHYITAPHSILTNEE